jgi:hypothetical protein
MSTSNAPANEANVPTVPGIEATLFFQCDALLCDIRACSDHAELVAVKRMLDFVAPVWYRLGARKHDKAVLNALAARALRLSVEAESVVTTLRRNSSERRRWETEIANLKNLFTTCVRTVHERVVV